MYYFQQWYNLRVASAASAIQKYKHTTYTRQRWWKSKPLYYQLMRFEVFHKDLKSISYVQYLARICADGNTGESATSILILNIKPKLMTLRAL